MNRKASTLMSLGISIALIAVGIWFLCNHQYTLGNSESHWIMPYHMMMSGAGMEIVIILFWIATLSAIAIVVSSVISNYRPSGLKGKEKSSHTQKGQKHRFAHGEIDKSKFEAMKHKLS